MSVLADGFSRYLNNTINYDSLYTFYKEAFTNSFDILLARPNFIDCDVGDDIVNFPKYPDYFNMYPNITKFNQVKIYESAADQTDELKKLITSGLVLQRRPHYETIAKDGRGLYRDLLIQYSYVRDMNDLFPESLFYRPFRSDTSRRNFMSLVQGDLFVPSTFGYLSLSNTIAAPIDFEDSSAIHLWLLFSCLGQSIPNMNDLAERSIEWILFVDQDFTKINTEITSLTPEDGTATSRGYHIEVGLNDLFIFSFESESGSPFFGGTDILVTLTASSGSPNSWTPASIVAADIQAAYDAAVIDSPGVYPPATIAYDKSGYLQIVAPSGFTKIFFKTNSTGARTLGFPKSNVIPVAEGLIADVDIEYTFTNGSDEFTAANIISADQIPIDYRVVYVNDTDNFAARVLKRTGLKFKLDRIYEGNGGTGNAKLGSPFNVSYDTMRVDFNNFIDDNYADIAKDLSNLVTKSYYDFVRPSEWLLNDIIATAIESKIQELADEFSDYMNVLQPSPVSNVCENISDAMSSISAGEILYQIHDSDILYPTTGGEQKRQHFDLGEATRWQNDPSQYGGDLSDAYGEDPNLNKFLNKVAISKIKDYLLLIFQYRNYPYKFINCMPLAMQDYTSDKVKTLDDSGWSQINFTSSNIGFISIEKNKTLSGSTVNVLAEFINTYFDILSGSPGNDGLKVFRNIFYGTNVFKFAITKYYTVLFDDFMSQDSFSDFVLEIQKLIFETIRDYGLVPYDFEWSKCVELVKIYFKTYFRKQIFLPENTVDDTYIMNTTTKNFQILYDQAINNNTGKSIYDITIIPAQTSVLQQTFDDMRSRFPTATYQFIENLLLSVLSREITYDKMSEYLVQF